MFLTRGMLPVPYNANIALSSLLKVEVRLKCTSFFNSKYALMHIQYPHSSHHLVVDTSKYLLCLAVYLHNSMVLMSQLKNNSQLVNHLNNIKHTMDLHYSRNSSSGLILVVLYHWY